MSDYKSAYSDISKDYIENIVTNNEIDLGRYTRSKNREASYNEKWLKQKVNLNELVDHFIPEREGFIKQRTEGGWYVNVD